jgi:hypothetical protein
VRERECVKERESERERIFSFSFIYSFTDERDRIIASADRGSDIVLQQQK